MIRITAFLLLCAIAVSAQPSQYQTTSKGLKYFIVRNAGKPKGNIGDITKVDITYSTQKDSVLFSTGMDGMGPIQLTITAPTFNGDPMEGFTFLGEGDSAIFLMPTDSAYKQGQWPPFAKPGEFVKIYVSILSLMTKQDFEMKQQLEASQQAELQTKAIQEWLTKNNLTAQKTASGLYYVIEMQGSGLKAEAGKKVTVNYTGKLLDGTMFDSSLNPGREPFSFQLGAGQVIKGWDEGIALFNVGGKGKLIIPSGLAYGSRSQGKIPSNSILIFDIELLGVE